MERLDSLKFCIWLFLGARLVSGGDVVVESFETFVVTLDKNARTLFCCTRLTLYTPSLSLNLRFKVLEVNQ